ncbi:MAG: hypothetical protein U0325_18610 [Polyangiales bacterium]
MSPRVAALGMIPLVLGACGARTGLSQPDRATAPDVVTADRSTPDVATADVTPRDVIVRDAPTRDAGPTACALRRVDGPREALTHPGGDRGAWVGTQVVFREGGFDAVSTLVAEVDDTFSQTRAIRVRHRRDVGLQVEVPPRTLFAAGSSTPAIAQDDALALCRWPSAGGMAAEVVRYWGAYEPLPLPQSYLGATGCVGLAASGDTLLVGTQIVVSRGLPEVWLARTDRSGRVVDALGPALLERPREGVGVGFVAHPSGARSHFVSAVRPGGFAEIGEVEGRPMGAVRRWRVEGLRFDPATEADAPALAFWPDATSLAMVHRVRAGSHTLVRVDLTTGAVRTLDLGTSPRAQSPTPAVLATPQALYVGLLSLGSGPDGATELVLLRVDPETFTVSSRTRLTVEGSTLRGAFSGLSLASDGDVVVVHWSGATDGSPSRRQTFLAAFGCAP